MKKKLKIADLCFYGDKTSSKYHDSKILEWDRKGGKPADSEPIFFTDSCLAMAQLPQYKNAYRIAWLIEPPVIRQDTYQFIAKYHTLFDLVLTHQLDFIPNIPNAQYAPGSMSWVAEEDWKKYDKTKGISIVASHKADAPGHIARHEFLKLNKAPIDVYGSITGKFLPHKIDALRDYKFQVVIENCQTNGYFTEKLLDCFATHTIPIYLGCPNIGDYFNEAGIVVSDDLEALVRQVEQVSKHIDKYGWHPEVAKAKEENFELAKQYYIAEDWIYNNILVPKGLV